MKKNFKRIFILVMIIMAFTTVNCFAKKDDDDALDIKEIVNAEEGSLFDKTIAKTIGGIAQAVFNIVTDEELDIGFKSYKGMLFRNNSNISPFSDSNWKKIMKWYSVFAYISGTLILIAVIIIAYKMIIASVNTVKRNEAKENLFNLAFGGVAIAVAPVFIKVLLFINNSLVNILVSLAGGSIVSDLFDEEFLSNISTGNPIATALVISMFIYIFVKLNIKFIIRKFTIIVFTIFTPIVVGLYIINKNVTAVAIWSGQIMVNIFMQFIYCFLFLLFSSFIAEDAGWAVTLIWAMMILPVADVLMNCLQNLTSRIAGLDNNEVSMRGIGLAGALGSTIGYSVSAIRTQFTSVKNTEGNGFIGRIKNIVNPQMNLSNNTDYNGNVNPIRNVIENKHVTNTNNTTNTNQNISNMSNNNINNPSRVMKIASGAVKATQGYLRMGANMAEGNFNNSKNDSKRKDNIIVERTVNQKINSEKESDSNEEK